MASIKYSNTNYASTVEYINTVCSDLDAAKSAIGSFNITASGYSSGWSNKAEEIATYTETDDKGNVTEHIDNSVYYSGLEQIATYNNCNNSVIGIQSRISSCRERIYGLGLALQKIMDSVKAFEDSHKVVNIEEIVNGLINSGEIDTSVFNAEKFSYELNDDGTYVMYYDLDGQKVTISDMVNAFYTYTGMSMNANIEGRYLAEQMGVEFDESYQMNIMNGVNGFMSDAVTNNYFGVASEESINAAADSLGIELSDNVNFDSILNAYGSNYDEDQINGLKNTMNGDVNSLLTMGASVGAGLLGAYTLTENLDFTKKAVKPVEPTPDPTPGGGGTTTPVQPNPNPTIPEEPVIKPIEPVEPVELVEIVDDEIPEEIVSEIEEQDFDELAREEFEAQGQEAIFERRSEIFKQVDEMVANGDNAAIKEKLSEYGYSDPEIEAILENPDYIKAAFVEGDQRAQLTEIANRLADESGVKDFDTKYDDGQDYQDLQDGTTSSEYIANMSLDENVVSTRETYKEAREAYETSIDEANNSINAAEEAKVNIEELREEYGEDTSKWTQEQADNYNAAVEDYNEAVKVANEKCEAVEATKEAYFEAKTEYTNAKNDFIERIKEQNDTTDGGSGEVPTDRLPEETGKPIETIDGGEMTPVDDVHHTTMPVDNQIVSEIVTPDNTGNAEAATAVIEQPSSQSSVDDIKIYDIPQSVSLAQAQIKPTIQGDTISVSDDQLLSALNIGSDSASFK